MSDPSPVPVRAAVCDLLDRVCLRLDALVNDVTLIEVTHEAHAVLQGGDASDVKDLSASVAMVATELRAIADSATQLEEMAAAISE